MEYAKCILCGHDALRKVYSSKDRDDVKRVNEAGGYCYDCHECRSYCFDNFAYNFFRIKANDKHKEIVSEYVKSHQLEGEYLELKLGDIKKILGLP